jgi:NADH dehydrogenase/NADH:ubiquinone oxidoreductase subunit G
MTIVNITVNGQKIQAHAGQTVYEAAAAEGIDIPVLCHHPALPPEGACRVCLVEIEKQRSLQPSCTFPVSEGMVVQTESERVVAARKFALELLFSERIHYCMVCPLSGDECGSQCELQRLAYRYGLTNWRYPPKYAVNWGVDASRKHFIMDHSRCILCRRCVRACDVLAANHTLGVRERGARTMVIADDDVPFGESTCVSCGTCLQVCPTGALIDRRSAFMGDATDLARTKTTCMACPVGCGIEAVTRGGQLVKVEGDWDAANGGLLCVHGRFDVVDPQPERVTIPQIRVDGRWAEVSWDEALAAAANGLKSAGSAAGLASPRATVEELSAFGALFDRVIAHRGPLAPSRSAHAAAQPEASGEAISAPGSSTQIGLLYGEVPPALGQAASLKDLEAADLIVVVSSAEKAGWAFDDVKVVGYVVRRTTEAGAKLLVVGEAPAAGSWADFLAVYGECAGLAEAAGAIGAAERPVVVVGNGLSAPAYDALRALPAKTRFLPLLRGANAAGAARQGLTARPVRAEALFILAGDDVPGGTGDESPAYEPARFTVVQAAYRSAWTEGADVILPARVWTEKDGTIVNVEGRELPVAASTTPPAGIPSDVMTLESLARRL